MKLKELKETFKHKYLIRIAAGVLIVAVVGSSAAVNNVYAAKQAKTEQEATEQETTEETDAGETKDTLRQMFSKDDKASEEEVGKEETVYIIADENGNAEQTIVSEWLKNPERNDRLCDVSDLKEIENVKGDETFEQNGSVLDWKADGNDIYYQGTTTKEAPVTEKITYYLDGKEISAKELAGKSGTVTIRFDYSNHQKEGDVYVPFLVISGMVLDSRCSNIQVTNGKVISNGEKQIVVGMAVPGLSESLHVTDRDFSEDVSIPEYVEVTADAEDFQLDMTMTVVTGASEFTSGTSMDLSGMDEKIDDLTDAVSRLKDGSGKLEDGMDTLDQKMGEFSGGTDTLAQGIAAYTNGAETLANGIGTLKGQSGLLMSGISDLVSSVGTLNDGVKTLDAALHAPMGTQEKDAAMAAAKTAAETAVETQFADASNPQSYQNIKAQAASAFYASVTTDAVKQSAAAAAKEQVATGIQSQKPEIAAAAKAQAAAGIAEQKPAIAAAAKAQASQAIKGQLDTIAAAAREQAVNAASGAISEDVKNQLKASFLAAGYVQAAQQSGGAMTVEQAMQNPSVQASVAQAAEAQLQGLLGNVGKAAGDVAEQTARSVADQVAGSAAEQTAGSVADQVAENVAGQAAVEGAESAKKQIAKRIETKDAKSGYSLVSGMNALYKGVGTISGKMPELKNGIEQLYDGSQTLASKNGELNSGAAKLKEGTGQLADGIEQLADGSKELAEGIVKFDEEGIETLVNSYNGDIKEFTGRIQKVLDAGGSYESFGGKEDDVRGNVKFIIKTRGLTEG